MRIPMSPVLEEKDFILNINYFAVRGSDINGRKYMKTGGFVNEDISVED